MTIFPSFSPYPKQPGKHTRKNDGSSVSKLTAYNDSPSLGGSAAKRFKPARRIKSALKGKFFAGMIILALGGSAMSAVALTGCSQDTSSSSEEASDLGIESAPAGSIIDTSLMDLDYSDRDLDGSYDAASSVSITLSNSGSKIETGSNLSQNAEDAVSIDGSTIAINDEGTYIVSGELSDGQIIIAAEDSDKVQIVLDNVTINNEDGSAIYVTSADKAFISLASESINSLSDGSSYVLEDGSDEPNATIFSKCDLTINGSGSLNVNASHMHGICSQDELKITGGTIDVQAEEDGIRGRDSLMIYDGTVSIAAGDDALKSTNDEDTTFGFVSIDGGDIAISAADKGISAETALLIRNGNITIESCDEGYQATLVQIDGGKSDITANDDGINASAGTLFETNTIIPANDTNAEESNTEPMDARSDMQEQDFSSTPERDDMQDQRMPDKPGQDDSEKRMPQDNAPDSMEHDMGGSKEERNAACQIIISGGVTIVDSEGDALDSNGDITILGGTVLANGSSGDVEVAMDYNGSAAITGGTAILAGSSGMAQSFSDGEQPFALVKASGSAGQSITLADENGNVLASMTASNDFDTVLVSSPDLVADSTYQIVVGGEIAGSTNDSNTIITSGVISGGADTTFTASTDSVSSFDGMQRREGGDMKEGFAPEQQEEIGWFRL